MRSAPRRTLVCALAVLTGSAAALTPNDPLYPTNQWPLHNPGGTVNPVGGGPLDLTEDADIDAPEAWDITTGSRDVVVAIIDTGADLTHPDLMANLWVNTGEIPSNGLDDDENGYTDDVHGYDFVDDDPDPSDTSAIAHGTRLAGQIGMVGDDENGGVGVCWQVSLMILRAQGQGTINEAFDYAIANGADIIHTSYGGFVYDAAQRDMFERAADAGLFVVAATGNNGIDIDRFPFYPATLDLPGLITVGATDQHDQIAAFSNIGANSVDLLAPGTPVWSTVRAGEGNPLGYGLQGGTSFAAPHATGVAALYLAENPETTGLELASRIMAGVDRPAGVAGATRSDGRLSAAAIWSDDTVPPGAVSDLWLNSVGALSAEISFTAPGDDGMTGLAAMLEVRLGDVSLTEGNWFEADRVWDVPMPLAGGEAMVFSLKRTQHDHLRPGQTYHVGVRAFDEAGNWSPVGAALMFSTPPVRTVLFDDFEGVSNLWTGASNWAPVTTPDGYTDGRALHNAITPLPPDTEIALTTISPLALGPAGGNWLSIDSAEIFDFNPDDPTEGVAIEVTTDGQQWESVGLLHSVSTPLRHHLFGLDSWAGQSVRLRFRLFTNADEDEASGLWLDNVHVFQAIEPADHAGISTR